MGSIRAALALVDARLGALLAASALLRFGERVALVLAAYAFAFETRRAGLALTLALAALFSLRGAVAARARTAAQARLHAAAVRAVLAGDVLRGSLLADDDAQLAVFEGIHHGGRLLYELAPDLAGDGVAAIAIAAILAATRPPALLVVGAVAIAFAAIGVLAARRVTARASDRAWREYRPVVDGVVASLGARLEIVASGRGDAFVERFDARLRAWRRVALRAESLAAVAGRAPIAAAAIGVGLAVIADRSLRGAVGAAALGDAALFASVVPAFTGIARAVHELVKGSAKWAPLAAMLGMARARAGEASAGGAPPPLPARIEWRDVRFAYTLPDGACGPLAIDGVSIAWEPRNVLVLEGANGAGKSTCLRLLLALAAPSGGAIAVAGRDLRTIDAAAWRRAIAYLPQRPFLPERASVREAMRLVHDDASDEAMRAALVRVELWAALARRAPGDPLGVPVSTLSAGQRQRVALARALLRDAPLVLLDEPDANLDADGVALVGRVVRELARDRMVAVVAHGDLRVEGQRVRLGG